MEQIKEVNPFWNDEDMNALLFKKEGKLPEKYASLKNTSERIRAMSADGFDRGAISRMLKIRYQHVRNVLVTPLKKKG